MRAINKKAAAILSSIVEGMEPGTSKKIDNTGGTFMPLSVERLTEDRYSMAHYFTQNGDLCADPDMEFWRGPDGKFYPIAIQQIYGYQVAMTFGADDKPSGTYPRAQREQAVFAAQWLDNIKSQQGL